jgi:polyphosphate glucokinase
LHIKGDELLHKRGKLPFYISNVGDLAGLAEMSLRVAKKEKGVVSAITIGSEIRSRLFYNGRLIPNLEVEKILHSNHKLIEFHTAIFTCKKGAIKI